MRRFATRCRAAIALLVTWSTVLAAGGWEIRMNGLPAAGAYYEWAAIANGSTIWISGSLAGKTLIYRSTDFGVTWIDANPSPDSTGIPALEVGPIAAWNDQEAVVATPRGAIFRTSDGGANWMLVFRDSAVTRYFNYMEMVDDSCGFAVGDAPSVTLPAAIVKTTDGGRIWSALTHDLPLGCNQYYGPTCDFVNREVGYTGQLVPTNPGGTRYRMTIFKTTDGGSTWTELPALPGVTYSVCFADESLGFLTETYQEPGVHRTTDGGMSWEYVKSVALAYFVTCAPGGTRIWAGTTELVASDDSGDTWYDQNVPLPVGGVLVNGAFANRDTGVLVGENIVLITTDGGAVTAVKDDPQLPLACALHQNYPNPFNPTTTIEYALPRSAFVTLNVYNILGEEVARLVDGEHSAGRFEVTWDAGNLPSGVYFYRLGAGDYMQTRQMLLTR